MNKVIITLVALTVLAVTFVYSPISPEETTKSNIMETSARINIYIEKEGKLPQSLSILPKRENYANKINDGWGRDLEYSIKHDENKVFLTSLGKDGEKGGVGKDRDITKKFEIIHTEDKPLRITEKWLLDLENKVESEPVDADNQITRP